MSNRRLAAADIQPSAFAFTAENENWAAGEIAKYPPGRQASAVIPLLWRAQEQAGGWLPQKAIEAVADKLGMPYIRVLEVATFYTMFELEPVGRYFIQLCGTMPCHNCGRGRAQGGAAPAHRRAEPRLGRRQVLLARGRVPRRLLQRADGADQPGLLRGPDARDLREAPRRPRRRARGEARSAEGPRLLRACRRREDAAGSVALRRLARRSVEASASRSRRSSSPTPQARPPLRPRALRRSPNPQSPTPDARSRPRRPIRRRSGPRRARRRSAPTTRRAPPIRRKRPSRRTISGRRAGRRRRATSPTRRRRRSRRRAVPPPTPRARRRSPERLRPMVAPAATAARQSRSGRRPRRELDG